MKVTGIKSAACGLMVMCLNRGLTHIHQINPSIPRCQTWRLNIQLVSSWCEWVQTDLMITHCILGQYDFFFNHSVVAFLTRKHSAISWDGFHLFKMRPDEGAFASWNLGAHQAPKHIEQLLEGHCTQKITGFEGVFSNTNPKGMCNEYRSLQGNSQEMKTAFACEVNWNYPFAASLLSVEWDRRSRRH